MTCIQQQRRYKIIKGLLFVLVITLSILLALVIVKEEFKKYEVYKDKCIKEGGEYYESNLCLFKENGKYVKYCANKINNKIIFIKE